MLHLMLPIGALSLDVPRQCSVLSRRRLLQLPPLAVAAWPLATAAVTTDPLFQRLRNRYILLRPGETTFEAAGIVDSNPINKQSTERGLTARGRQQVGSTVDALKQLGVSYPIVFYDNGARASQTADIVAAGLTVPRARMEPEFRWLEARGLGELDGAALPEVRPRVLALDSLDMDARPETSDDGTPADSVNDVFSRMRNTIGETPRHRPGGRAKKRRARTTPRPLNLVRVASPRPRPPADDDDAAAARRRRRAPSQTNAYASRRVATAKIENSYSGEDAVIVAGDGTVLSVFAAASCGADLREHARFELPPGDFFDLPQLTREYQEGTFRPRPIAPASAEGIAAGRAALQEFGQALFSETAAGSWVLGCQDPPCR